MVDYNLDKRKYVIGGVAIAIVVIYTIRLFTLQIMSEDYKKNADSNAFLKQIEFPSRGAIYDRNGKLMVYNSPSYDIMVVMKEQEGRLDTMDFCNSLGITKEAFEKRMETIKDRSKNPGYSRYTQQLFMSQLSDKDFSVFQEKMFRFPGFYVQKRSVREYAYPYAAHVLGDVGEVSPSDIEDDDYYQPGDYIGKLGLEKHYEKELRGTKGVKIMLRDARGRIQGSYQNGKLDQRPIAGKDLTLGIDVNLQALGERLLQGKIGSIVAIDPRDGSVLAMVSSPTYDPRRLVGKNRGKMHKWLSQNPWKPLLNRSIMGQYPPGSTFKTTQALTYLTEGIITPGTAFPCNHGFSYRGLHVGCHGHPSPIALVDAISTSCNGYFCWGLYYMIGNKKKYGSVQEAMTVWKDYMVSMGFGYKLGIDLPGEKRGLIPNAQFYPRRRCCWVRSSVRRKRAPGACGRILRPGSPCRPPSADRARFITISTARGCSDAAIPAARSFAARSRWPCSAVRAESPTPCTRASGRPPHTSRATASTPTPSSGYAAPCTASCCAVWISSAAYASTWPKGSSADMR